MQNLTELSDRETRSSLYCITVQQALSLYSGPSSVVLRASFLAVFVSAWGRAQREKGSVLEEVRGLQLDLAALSMSAKHLRRRTEAHASSALPGYLKVSATPWYS